MTGKIADERFLDTMEKVFLAGLAVIFFLMAVSAVFDRGVHAAGSVQVETGNFPDVRRVTMSSTTGTALFSGSTNRADGACRSNSSTTVWIGTVSAAVNGQYHTNIVNGTFILSSEPFKLDGRFTGWWYGTCDVGVASCEARCLDGLVTN